ncbi:hypothetical protein DLM85_13450 [Hymenobacter edaphi]|uniref:Uncharacterized protein n=1 Tax=Hymenobacter edaphi TaxID=2211146 RepID=A0A328BIJ0_9BACT|nr:hypothetical protein DLM85_13450 [Hymenobacter edaphi]
MWLGEAQPKDLITRNGQFQPSMRSRRGFGGTCASRLKPAPWGRSRLELILKQVRERLRLRAK